MINLVIKIEIAAVHAGIRRKCETRARTVSRVTGSTGIFESLYNLAISGHYARDIYRPPTLPRDRFPSFSLSLAAGTAGSRDTRRCCQLVSSCPSLPPNRGAFSVPSDLATHSPVCSFVENFYAATCVL